MPDDLEPVENLPDVFTATSPLVDTDSGRRPSPFTDETLRRLRIRRHRPERRTEPQNDEINGANA